MIADLDKLVNRVDTLISQNDKAFPNGAIIAFLGGFSGAFFAFIFERFAGYISKKRERYYKHKNAMVRMEYVLVKHQDKIGRLVFLLNNTIDILKGRDFTHNRFTGLNTVEGLELELGDINLINDVSNYWLSVERVNSDCDSINRILETLQKIGLSGIKPHDANFIQLIKLMEQLRQYLREVFLDENTQLNAYLRILMAEENRKSGISKFLNLYRVVEIKVSKNQIDKIKKKIYEEIKARKAEDKERLSKIPR